MLTGADPDALRRMLCALGESIRDGVVAARSRGASLTDVAEVTPADAIYSIDKVADEAILSWFEERWPDEETLQLVMEGVPEDQPVTFPRGTPVGATRWRCLMDPIDGTRGLMYDKRSAWVLAALAPQQGADTRLSQVAVAAMTEIPTTKQWRGDQVSAVRGCGVVGEAIDLRSGGRVPLRLHPSRASDFRHGYASIARFFPEGKAALAALEEELWGELHGVGSTSYPLVFDDQYACTGGQLYELAVGHDRMLGDLRPLAFRKQGLASAVSCHPYDICTALVLTEAGGLVETPDGDPLDVPLDTTTPVAWMGYANEALAAQVRPVLRRLLGKHFGAFQPTDPEGPPR